MNLVPRETLFVEGFDGQIAGVRNPTTGEIVSFQDTPGLVDWKLALKDHRDALTEAARVVDAAILDEMDRNASWTINRPAGAVSAPSPSAGDAAADAWDGNRLWQVLTELMKAGTITDQARDSAVKVVTEYKAKAAGVKALLKIPAIAPYIETCRLHVEPKRRSVSVK